MNRHSFPIVNEDDAVENSGDSVLRSNQKSKTRPSLFAEKVAGYRSTSQLPKASWGRWGRKGTTFDVYMRSRDPLKMAAAAVLLISIGMMIGAMSVNGMFVWVGPSAVDLEIGMWRWSAAFNSPSASYSGDTCEDPGWVAVAYSTKPPVSQAFKATECFEAIQDKCKAAKAFSVIGLFANVFAMVLLFAPVCSYALSSAFLSALSAVSYTVCFSTYASLYTGKKVVAADGDPDHPNCGLGWSNSDDISLGPSFNLTVASCVASIISLCFAMASTRDAMNSSTVMPLA